MDIINKRRSIRKYINKEIEQEVLEKIVRAGMQAPSAINQQPWHFFVIKDKDKLIALSKLTMYSKMLANASACILLATDKRNVKASTMYSQDMAAATQNVLLEAAYLGVGSCWIGIYGRIDRMEKVKDFLLLEEHFEPFALVSLGYPENKDDFKFVDRYNINKVTYEV
ncbi:MAG TPA: nitroreductase family protein [Acholeplasmataceae bacterium]|nr:nitroreductase family protein [Acholeplasmataceae bacterium]